MATILQSREEYTFREVEEQGLTHLFIAFERDFRQHLSGLESFFQNLTRSDINITYKTPNFNRYKGDLERVCHAAQEIAGKYDFAMGIAKKGLWLSYVFKQHDLPIYDSLVFRNGQRQRIMCPLSNLTTAKIKNKKILICENDLVTGNTIDAVSTNLLQAGAKQVDLLLIYTTPELKPTFYEEVNQKFFASALPVIGQTIEGDIVVDTSSRIPKSIGQSYSLQRNFNAGRQYLMPLAQKYGVLL